MKLIYHKNKNFKCKYYNLNKNIFLTHSYNNLLKSYIYKLLYYLKYFYNFNTNTKYKIYFNNKYNFNERINLFYNYYESKYKYINILDFNINYYNKLFILKYTLLN